MEQIKRESIAEKLDRLSALNALPTWMKRAMTALAWKMMHQNREKNGWQIKSTTGIPKGTAC